MKHVILPKAAYHKSPTILALLWLGAATLALSAGGQTAGGAASGAAPSDDDAFVAMGTLVVEGKAGSALALGHGMVDFSRLDSLTERSSTSAYDAVAGLPSVYRESSDAFGLSEKNQHPAIKIRGKASSGPVAIRNIEGVPVQGTPGGGDHFVDMENIASATLYKGAFAPQFGLGFTNLLGKIDVSFDRPHATSGITATQAVGSEGFYRSFLRLDSGEAGPLKAFVSGSLAHADKFKGEGDYERKNAMLGLSAGGGEGLSVETYVLHNDYTQFDYSYLSYGQILNLSAYKSTDFTDDPKDMNFYDYNKQKFEDAAAMAIVRYRWDANRQFTLKPYYWQDKGYYLSAAQSGMIRKWLIDHNLYGAVAEWAGSEGAFSYVAGFFWHRQQRPGSPTQWKMYAVASGAPVFKKWGLLSNDSYHQVLSPYATLGWKTGRLRLEGGGRLVRTDVGSQYSYTTTAGDVSYEDALASATLDAQSSSPGLRFNQFQPYLSGDYSLTSRTGLYAGYNRTAGFDVNLYPTYVNGKASYLVPLSDIFGKERMETSDNFDLGLRTEGKTWTLKSGLYYTAVSNKQIAKYDPAVVVAGATYPTNAADAHSEGIEVEWNQKLFEGLSLSASASRNLYEYDEDISVLDKDGKVSTANGHQVVDVPEYLANLGLNYGWRGFAVSPSCRYVGRRYADSANSQALGGKTLWDLRISYACALPGLGVRRAEFALTATNLFDKCYVGVINGSDYFYGGASGQATFLLGAPRAVVGSVSLTF